MQGRLDTQFRIRISIPPQETAYLRASTAETFMYDALDGEVEVLLGDRSAFVGVADHRVSSEGRLSSVPVLVFLERLSHAVLRLASGRAIVESVPITSTDYRLEFDRSGSIVRLLLTGGKLGAARSLDTIE